MSNEKIKITIISDLVKIDNYRSHINKPDNSFLQEIYGDQSIDDLKRIHDIYTRYLLDYITMRMLICVWKSIKTSNLLAIIRTQVSINSSRAI
jgi:hypothetical protein